MSAIQKLTPPQCPPLEQLLSVQAVADLLDVATKTIYRHVWNGTLPHVKVGRLLRVRESDLQVFLKATNH